MKLRFALALLAALGCAHAPPGRTPQIAISFDPTSLQLCQGMAEYVQVHVGWTGSGAAPDAPPDLQWTSRSPAVVRAESDGRIVAIRPGKGRVRVRAAWGSNWNSADLRVAVHPGSPPDTLLGPRILTAPTQCR